MKPLIYIFLLFQILPNISYSQEFIPSEYYKIEVISEDLNEVYNLNSEHLIPSISYSFYNNAAIYEHYVYYQTRGDIYRVATDGSAVDSLYGTNHRDYRINSKYPLNSFSLHDSILTIYDSYKWQYLMSKDRGKNWSVIYEVVPDKDSLRDYFSSFDENNHIRVFFQVLPNQNVYPKLAITKNKFATLDTIDVLSQSGLETNPGMMSIASYGETADDIYITYSQYYNKISESEEDTIKLQSYDFIISSDGGKSWQKKNADTKYNNSTDLFKIFGDTIYTFGRYQEQYGLKNDWGGSASSYFGNVKVSTDKGDSWSDIIRIDSFPNYLYYGMFDSQKIFFSTLKERSGPRRLFNYSIDGGKRFYVFDTGYYFNSYYFSGYIASLDSRVLYLFLGEKFYKIEFLSATDVQENLPEEYKIYPNPATDFITINEENIHKYQTFEISDIMGRAVQSGTVESDKIMLSDFPKGIYFLKLIGTTETKSMKFLRE